MNIDWTLLKQQKQTLLELLDTQKQRQPIILTPQDAEHLTGLLHLCDSLEDDFKPR